METTTTTTPAQENVTESAAPAALEVVKPMSEFNALKPENGVRYVTDEEFARMKPDGEGQQKQDNADAAQQSNSSAEPVAIDFDSLVKEKTGGKFEKWEDLSSFINEPVKFENELSKQAFEYLSQGKVDDVVNIMMQQRVLASVDSMDNEGVIKMYMRLSDPELTDEDVEIDFEDKYQKPDLDAMSEEDGKRAMRKYERLLARDSKEAKDAISKLKQEIKFPALEKNEKSGIKPDELDAEIAGINKGIAASVQEGLKNLGKITINVEDKQQGVAFPVEFSISEDDKAGLIKSHEDFFTDFETRYGQGDRYDGEKLAKDRFILDNFDKLIKSAALNAYNKGKLDSKLASANTDLNTERGVPNDLAKDKVAEGLRNFLRG